MKNSNYKYHMSRFPEKTPDAMAYVPFQIFEKTFEPKQALKAGTIFPELYKPFLGGKGGRNV